MSTKNTQTNTSDSNLKYNPKSLALYKNLITSGGNVLQGYMNNPFNNGFFNLGQGMGQAAAQSQGATNMKALMQNMKTSGISGNAGNAFQLSQMGKIGRSTASMGAQSTMQNVLGALNRQMTATGMGMSFNPLLMGENSASKTVQQQSGLGTWLPQVLSTAASIGLAPFTGGLSLAGLGGAAAHATSAGAPSGGIGGMLNAGNTFMHSDLPPMNPFMYPGLMN